MSSGLGYVSERENLDRIVNQILASTRQPLLVPPPSKVDSRIYAVIPKLISLFQQEIAKQNTKSLHLLIELLKAKRVTPDIVDFAATVDLQMFSDEPATLYMYRYVRNMTKELGRATFKGVLEVFASDVKKEIPKIEHSVQVIPFEETPKALQKVSRSLFSHLFSSIRYAFLDKVIFSFKKAFGSIS